MPLQQKEIHDILASVESIIQEFIMSEEEKQCNCEENKCECGHTTFAYDLCAIIFCICPVLALLFTIDFHNANNIVNTAIKALAFSLFPLAISLIGIKEKERKNDSSHIALTLVVIIDIIYAMILLFGFLEGGKLFG